MLRLTYAASDLEVLEGLGGWAAEALAAEEEEQGERLHALDHLRAINNCLVLMTGRGLEQFMPTDEAEMSQATGYGRRPRRVLTCCLDQGLAGYSMMSFLLYKAQLRVVHINDIYHREWNDVKYGLQRTHLWQSVVLTTLAFNLFYGPWETCTWHSKMVENTEEWLCLVTPRDPLFLALYERICKDQGQEPSGDPQHALEILLGVARAKCWKTKGPKVTLRRWFSWLPAFFHYDTLWHTLLLLLSVMGIRKGAYTRAKDLPFLSPPSRSRRVDPEAVPQGAPDAAGSGVGGGSKAGSAAGSSSDAPGLPPQGAKPPAGQETAVDPTEQELWRKWRNTLLVVAAVYSHEGLQQRCRLVFTFCNPARLSHSAHAKEVRSASETLRYYASAATGSLLKHLNEMVAVLSDSARLAYIGFDMEFATAASSSDSHCQLLEQDSLASKGLAFLQALLGSRLSSICWHMDHYPGRFAALCTGKQADRDEFLKAFRLDYRAYLEAQHHSAGSALLRKLVTNSCFQQVVVRDVAQLLTVPSLRSVEDIMDECIDYASRCYLGFGQTKVVEDTFQTLRKREKGDAADGTFRPMRVWATSQSSKVFQLHRREPHKSPAQPSGPIESLPTSTFDCKGEPVLLDHSSLTAKATWPTFNAQSVRTFYAQQALMRFCFEHACFWQAGHAWKCQLLPAGVVFWHKGQEKYFLSLGDIGMVALLVWPLAISARTAAANGGETLWFSLEQVPENSQMPWVVVLDLDIAEVFPTAVASPARMRADLGLSDGAACPQVALKQTGPGTTAVKHAALHAFWTLPKGLLKKLCMDMQPRVTSEGELPDIVLALLLALFPSMSEEEVAQILRQRSEMEVDMLEELLPDEVAEELLASSDVKEAQDTVGGKNVTHPCSDVSPLRTFPG